LIPRVTVKAATVVYSIIPQPSGWFRIVAVIAAILVYIPRALMQ
jgi:hypothetical protein